MDRRTFVKSGVGSLAVSSVNPVEITDFIAPHWRNVSHMEMNHFFGQFDNAMLRTEGHQTSGIYVKEFLKDSLEGFDEKLFRGSFRSLLLAGNFGDLSIDGQMHPGVQNRLEYSAAEVDATMEGVIEKLRSFSSEDCLELKSMLNEDPEFVENLLEVLDKEALAVGAHKRRRKRLKRLGERVINQLKHSPEKLINDSLKKCDTLLERFSTEEEIQKFMQANNGKKRYQRKVEEAEKAVLRWKEMDLELKGPQYSSNVMLNEDEEVQSSDDETKKKKGLKLLGIGGVITAVGLLLIALAGASDAMFFIGAVAGWTVGPILIITALIIIIIVAVRKKKNR